jgi:hypothetical protein
MTLYLLPSEVDLRPRFVPGAVVNFGHPGIISLLTEEIARSKAHRLVCCASHPSVEAYLWERLVAHGGFLSRASPFRDCGIDILTKQNTVRARVVNLMRKIVERDMVTNGSDCDESLEEEWRCNKSAVVKAFFNNPRFIEETIFRLAVLLLARHVNMELIVDSWRITGEGW